jgi:hypothetical protein
VLDGGLRSLIKHNCHGSLPDSGYAPATTS